MKDRIKLIRKNRKETQTEFGALFGVSLSAVQKWESGENVPASSVITLMASKTGVNEFWLRNGKGDMYASQTRAEELDEFVDSVLQDRPDSFRSALVDTLLHFQPEEWELLEKIFDSIQEKREKKTDEE